MAHTSSPFRGGSAASSEDPDSAGSGAAWRILHRRRIPRARMEAISRRRWSGVSSVGSSSECIIVGLRVECTHNGFRLTASSLSGWVDFSLVFTYPAEVQNVGLGCGRKGVVNPERAVKQRVREFWRPFLGSGRKPGLCDRTPNALSRNRGRGRCTQRGANVFENGRLRRSPGDSLPRGFALTGVRRVFDV